MAWVGDMMMEGLAGGIDESAGEVIDSANAMKKDLNSVFNDLTADVEAIPTDFNINKTIDGAITPTQNSGGVVIQLNIDTFNNYTADDIEGLTNEIMETAGNFMKRKGAVFA